MAIDWKVTASALVREAIVELLNRGEDCPPVREVGRAISTHDTLPIIPLGRDSFLCFQELDIHCMQSFCCDSQIGGGVQPKSVNDDQKKGAIPTEGAEPVKRSGPKLVIRIDLERAGNGRRRGKRVHHP